MHTYTLLCFLFLFCLGAGGGAQASTQALTVLERVSANGFAPGSKGMESLQVIFWSCRIIEGGVQVGVAYGYMGDGSIGLLCLG